MRIEKIIYAHDNVIKNGQIHHWSLKIKIYMIYFQKRSSELIYAQWKIN